MMLQSFNPRARDERDWQCAGLLYVSACFNPRARDERDIFDGAISSVM